MTDARWYITQHAVQRYMHARRWPDDDAHFERAEDELLEMSAHANFRRREKHLEEWRSPRRTGGGLRWLVDTRRPATFVGGIPLARVVWVGYHAAPFEHFLSKAT